MCLYVITLDSFFSFVFFFFSSRRRHTRFDCDWSSDVCSSDLVGPRVTRPPAATPRGDAKVASMPIRESAPLCLTRALAGEGPPRLGVDHRPRPQNASSERGLQGGEQDQLGRELGQQRRASRPRLRLL